MNYVTESRFVYKSANFYEFKDSYSERYSAMKERNIMPFLGGAEMSMSCEFNLKLLTKFKTCLVASD